MTEVQCHESIDPSPLTMEIKGRDTVGNVKELCLMESSFCACVLLANGDNYNAFNKIITTLWKLTVSQESISLSLFSLTVELPSQCAELGL